MEFLLAAHWAPFHCFFFNLCTCHLVVDVVSAHGDRVHDVLPTLILSGGAVWDVVGVMLCSEVMAELVGGHQVGFLWRRRQTVVVILLKWRRSHNISSQTNTHLRQDGLPIILSAGQTRVEVDCPRFVCG